MEDMMGIDVEELRRLVEILVENAPHVEGWHDGETGEDIPLADAMRQAAETIDHLARRVIAAEKLVDALMRLSTAECFGDGRCLGKSVQESAMVDGFANECLSRMNFARAVLDEYEATK
jgi:hypothetical protein